MKKACCKFVILLFECLHDFKQNILAVLPQEMLQELLGKLPSCTDSFTSTVFFTGGVLFTCIYIFVKKNDIDIQGRTSSEKMYLSPALSISICMFFHMLIHLTSILIRQPSELVNSTCKQCAEKSPIFYYDFCVTSLQPVPISQATNLQGLAVVAMELALENATSTISAVKKMLSSKAFDPFAMECLTDCLELYGDAVSLLESSIASFLSEQFDAANMLMTAVMDEVATCEEGFTEKKGEVTPLMKENYNLFEISSIALCVTNLLSLKTLMK